MQWFTKARNGKNSGVKFSRFGKSVKNTPPDTYRGYSSLRTHTATRKVLCSKV